MQELAEEMSVTSKCRGKYLPPSTKGSNEHIFETMSIAPEVTTGATGSPGVCVKIVPPYNDASTLGPIACVYKSIQTLFVRLCPGDDRAR